MPDHLTPAAEALLAEFWTPEHGSYAHARSSLLAIQSEARATADARIAALTAERDSYRQRYERLLESNDYDLGTFRRVKAERAALRERVEAHGRRFHLLRHEMDGVTWGACERPSCAKDRAALTPPAPAAVAPSPNSPQTSAPAASGERCRVCAKGRAWVGHDFAMATVGGYTYHEFVEPFQPAEPEGGAA